MIDLLTILGEQRAFLCEQAGEFVRARPGRVRSFVDFVDESYTERPLALISSAENRRCLAADRPIKRAKRSSQAEGR